MNLVDEDVKGTEVPYCDLCVRSKPRLVLCPGVMSSVVLVLGVPPRRRTCPVLRLQLT